MRRGILIILLTACGGGAASDLDDYLKQTSITDAGPVDSGTPADSGTSMDSGTPDSGTPDAGPTRIGPALYLLALDAGAYPATADHPNALVYVPANFNPTPPIDLIVWLHGFNNCIVNIIRDAGESCDPDAGTPARNAYQLISQLEQSNKNALLLAPELAFDQATGNPGKLGDPSGFFDLLDETLIDLKPALGEHNVADIGTVVVASHSGGYDAAAGIISVGGVPVREVWLFDSLYGFTADFDAWVKSDLIGISSTQRRFGTVYTLSGGTLANSQDMADRAAGWVDAGVIHDDRTTSTWTLPEFEHGLLFKRSALAHDDVPRYYFLKFLQTSTLNDRQ